MENVQLELAAEDLKNHLKNTTEQFLEIDFEDGYQSVSMPKMNASADTFILRRLSIEPFASMDEKEIESFKKGCIREMCKAYDWGIKPDAQPLHAAHTAGITPSAATLHEAHNEGIGNFLNYTQRPQSGISFIDSAYVYKISKDVLSYIPQNQDRVVKGSIVAPVQSGKTAAIETLNHLFIGKTKRCIIINLSSNKNVLNEQSIERISGGIGYYSKPKWEINFVVNHKSVSRISHQTNHYVFNLKKHESELKHLLRLFRENEELIRELGYKVFLLEDESDDASVNTNPADGRPTSTHRLVRELVHTFENQTTYIAISATPFGNMAAYDPNEERNLAITDFISFFEPHGNYLGIDAIARNCFVPLEDNEDKVMKVANLRESIELLIAQTYIAQNNLAPELKTGKTALFVANVRTNSEQERVGQKAKEVISRLKKKDLGKIIDAKLEEFYSHMNIRFDESLGFEFPQFEIMVINKNWKDNLSFNNPKSAIIIGGKSLSRGVTIENLTIQHYWNDYTKQLNIDTVTQGARAAGNRLHMKNFIKVFGGEMTLEALNSTMSLQNRLKKAIAETKDGDITRLYEDLELDGFSPTAANKRRKCVIDKDSKYFSGTTFYPKAFRDDLPSRNSETTVFQKKIYSTFSHLAQRKDDALVLKKVPASEILSYFRGSSSYAKLESTLGLFGHVDVMTKIKTKQAKRSKFDTITLAGHTIPQTREVREKSVEFESQTGELKVNIANDRTGMECIEDDALCELVERRNRGELAKSLYATTQYMERPVLVFHNIELVLEGSREELLTAGLVFPNIDENKEQSLNLDNPVGKVLKFKKEEKKEGAMYA